MEKVDITYIEVTVRKLQLQNITYISPIKWNLQSPDTTI